VLCFSLVQPNSFANVKNRWYPELKEYCPTTPILLVGTKLDLTNDDATMRSLARQSLAPITRDQALRVADELKLEGYVECSGLTQAGVKVVFDEAANLAVGKPLMKDDSGMLSSSGSSKRLKKMNSNSGKRKRCCIFGI